MSHRLGVTKLPIVKSVERAPATRERGERGVATGKNARGDRVVFDVARGTLTRNDDAPITIAGAQDPMTPGLVAVDDAGARALVLCARSAHGDPSLVLVDLDERATQTVRSFDGPGWMCGGFAGPLAKPVVVACEQRLGDAPAFSVVVAGKVVWSVNGACPPCVPVRIKDDVVALLAVPAPDPMTFTGASALVALDLASGATRVLAPAEGTRVIVDGAALVVEGGAERVRVVLA